MFDLDLMRLVAAKGGRPLSVASLVSAIFLPSSLLVYLTRPDLFTRFGIVGGLLFGAACGFPVVFACTWPWYALFSAASENERYQRRVLDAINNAPIQPEPSLAEKVAIEDPFEWPTLLLGGWTANSVLYLLVAIAYYERILLGATLLLTVAITFGVWVVLQTLFRISLNKARTETDATVETIRAARLRAQPRQE